MRWREPVPGGSPVLGEVLSKNCSERGKNKSREGMRELSSTPQCAQQTAEEFPKNQGCPNMGNPPRSEQLLPRIPRF